MTAPSADPYCSFYVDIRKVALPPISSYFVLSSFQASRFRAALTLGA